MADNSGAESRRGRKTTSAAIARAEELIAEQENRLREMKKNLLEKKAILKSRDMEKNRQRYQEMGAKVATLGLDLGDLRLIAKRLGETDNPTGVAQGDPRRFILNALGINAAPPSQDQEEDESPIPLQEDTAPKLSPEPPPDENPDPEALDAPPAMITLKGLDTRTMSDDEKASLKMKYGMKWNRDLLAWEVRPDHPHAAEAAAKWGDYM